MGYMTNGLTFNDFQAASESRMHRAKKYRKSRQWTHAQWMMAILGELGELANVLKKVDRGDMSMAEARPLIEAELADVICYLPGLAASITHGTKSSINLGHIVQTKFNAVSDRVGSTVKVDHEGWTVGVGGPGDEERFGNTLGDKP